MGDFLKQEQPPIEAWSTIRFVTTETAGDVKVNLYNPDKESVQIFKGSMTLHEQLKPALYSDGDSISEGARYVIEIAGTPTQFSSPGTTYTAQYGYNNKIDYEHEAVGGEKLVEIKDRVIANTANRHFDVMFLNGGTNDIIEGSGDVSQEMYDNATLMIDAAKLACNNIILLTSPSCPVFTSAEQGYNDTYNNLIKAKYEYDTFVTVLDLDLILVASDFTLDELHINITGHNKINVKNEKIVPLPQTAETYVEIITTPDIVVDSNKDTAKDTERINIDWTLNKTITEDYSVQGNNVDVTIYLDGTGNTVTATLPASPAVGEIHTLKSIDATFTCTVDGNGNNIDGLATRPLALNASITIQYDGTEWRIL